MDIVSKIMAYEGGEMEVDDVLEFFSELVSTGYIHHLQGSYQRTANDLLVAGLI